MPVSRSSASRSGARSGRPRVRRPPRRRRHPVEFAYYSEGGAASVQAPCLREGLTSQIFQIGEPLLLNRAGTSRPSRAKGRDPARSYLGVPILVGDQAIGVVSVQSTTEEGRFGEADARLRHDRRQRGHGHPERPALSGRAAPGDEMAALAEVGREISATLDPQPCSSGSPSGPEADGGRHQRGLPG